MSLRTAPRGLSPGSGQHDTDILSNRATVPRLRGMVLLGIHRVGGTGAPGHIEAAQMTMNDNAAVAIIVVAGLLFWSFKLWLEYRGRK